MKIKEKRPFNMLLFFWFGLYYM